MKENDHQEPRLRTFVGIELSAAANAVLNQWMQHEHLVKSFDRAGNQVRRIPARNRHVTLVFLGDTASARIAEIQNILQAASREFSPFGLQFDRIASFPDAKSRIIAALCPLVPELEQMHREVSKRLHQCDRRRFKPHITLARLKCPMPWLRPTEFAPLELQVSSLALFESQLTPGGSEYSVIQRWALTG
ncbi:RNA 2',3'-cyclic phosphodiesterase [Pseudomaricurvus alkylphenolicus]|uniref:RNA 2',3'-cyclic phosphodiesterase n=1 Tax=Pseudomaricurvus alkylphenolicus TaxID=1306991 RepID=UPI00141FF846|nr:RNA 2',3'-cyclic phosphodiesterase [Pseudomaricurvus alkylphenolicus]NIB43853.1 RNA 2',3'-cyclic phosphodiesterase [Pseudomaricurvus alkylphenolicus]